MAGTRCCTSTAGINARDLSHLPGDMRSRVETELNRWHGWVGKQLWTHDDPGVPVEIVTARVDDHVRRFGRLDFVVIDHMHLLRSNQRKYAGNREAEMGYIAKELKRCFKRVDVTGFVLAQLNRSPGTGKDRRPPTSLDIRNSGEIEQAADDVMLIDTPYEDMRGSEQTKGQRRVMVEILKDKSRNGPTEETAVLVHDGHLTLFSDLREHEGSGQSAQGSGTPPTKQQFHKP